jgi:hypothetical protein
VQCRGSLEVLASGAVAPVDRFDGAEHLERDTLTGHIALLAGECQLMFAPSSGVLE